VPTSGCMRGVSWNSSGEDAKGEADKSAMYAKRASPVAASTRLTARQSEMSLHPWRQCVPQEAAVRWGAREVYDPVTPERGKQRLLRHTRPVDRVPERRGEHADLEQHLRARE
jgi:hypothetical protein